ncbi:MAG: hypothetical protein D6813_11375 [Calditrichaeota bacterium]|nr:MAG: hypothetical protein D6813_11375 [Calditrichota bacterium]
MKSKSKKSRLKNQSTLSPEKEYVETREDYLVRGHNGLESAVIISDRLGNIWGGPKLMEWDKVKFILQTLNDHKIKYAIIGGIAMGQHALPRTTHDIDIMVATKDMAKVRRIFEKYYIGGTPVVQMYDVEGTRLDVLPANLRYRIEALQASIDSNLEEVPTKVVNVRDLLLLKLLAVPGRQDLGKKRSDEADITELLKYGKNFLTKEDIHYIGENILALAYTKEELLKYQEVLRWFNETLDLLDLGEWKYPL